MFLTTNLSLSLVGIPIRTFYDIQANPHGYERMERILANLKESEGHDFTYGKYNGG